MVEKLMDKMKIIKYGEFVNEGIFNKHSFVNTDLGNDNYASELKLLFSKIMAQFNPDDLVARELSRVGSYRITYTLGGSEITIVGSTKNGIFYGNNLFLNGDYVESKNQEVIKLVGDIGTYLFKKYQDKLNTNTSAQNIDLSIQKFENYNL